MALYPEMFLAKWHLIIVFWTGIVLFGLIIGGYSKKTIISSTIKWLVAIYIIVTVPIALFTMDAKHMEEEMVAGLDEVYQTNKGKVENDHLVAYVGSFEDEDGDFEVKIYGGNYDNSEKFSGNVTILIYGEDGSLLKEETYEGISLEPGDSIELDNYFTTNEAPARFQYAFEG
ncbi:hypothetical protein FRY77_27510 [Halomonas sp. MG34]|nr:hypothetical protein [Halomonas sp. MG34]